MIIPPSELQSVRLLWPGTREKERYYRVRFTPVVPDKSNDFGLSDKQIQAYKGNINAGVNILTGYGSILYVMPEAPAFNTAISHAPTGINIKNLGNATIVLDDIRHCNDKNGDCSASSRQMIIPGKSTLIKKENGKIIKFRLNEAGNTKEFSW